MNVLISLSRAGAEYGRRDVAMGRRGIVALGSWGVGAFPLSQILLPATSSLLSTVIEMSLLRGCLRVVGQKGRQLSCRSISQTAVRRGGGGPMMPPFARLAPPIETVIKPRFLKRRRRKKKYIIDKNKNKHTRARAYTNNCTYMYMSIILTCLPTNSFFLFYISLNFALMASCGTVFYHSLYKNYVNLVARGS